MYRASNLLTCTTTPTIRLHWHCRTTRGHASHTCSTTLSETFGTHHFHPSRRPASRRFRAASSRICRAPIEPAQFEAPGRSKSKGPATTDRPKGNCPNQAIYAEGCGRPRRHSTTWRDHLHIQEQQDQSNHLLATGAAECTTNLNNTIPNFRLYAHSVIGPPPRATSLHWKALDTTRPPPRRMGTTLRHNLPHR
jgi:hypothetical protein